MKKRFPLLSNAERMFLEAADCRALPCTPTVYLFCHYRACQQCLGMPHVTQKQTQSCYINDSAEII